MKVLAIGDIFGQPGREAISMLLPRIIKDHSIDFVIANAENAAGGRGLTSKVAEELMQCPIDVMTAGNHIWEYDELHPYFDTHPILRPINVVDKLPGRGWLTKTAGGLRIAVVCLQGQVFMEEKGPRVSNPFIYMESIMPALNEESDLIIIDFHAEATSEKRALAWFLDGKVTAILGTHTHVQTADEQIMPGGTAYITDLGMTGPHASVIGLEAAAAIKRFLTGERKHFKVAKEGVRLEGVIIEVDEMTKKPQAIIRLQMQFKPQINTDAHR